MGSIKEYTTPDQYWVHLLNWGKLVVEKHVAVHFFNWVNFRFTLTNKG